MKSLYCKWRLLTGEKIVELEWRLADLLKKNAEQKGLLQDVSNIDNIRNNLLIDRRKVSRAN